MIKKPTFGWIYHTFPRDNTRIETLYAENSHFLDLLRGSFETLWFDDHLQKAGAPLLETWTTLTYIAAQNPDFKVGTLVLCQSFRNPGLLGKMMATLQILSGGRYIAGIGAGWKEDEYQAFGYEYPPAKIRLEQLEEAVQLFRVMWSHSPATFEGKHYSLCQADCEPLPQPPPPLLVGGKGEKFALRVVAKHADWMNITFVDVLTYAHKLEVLKQHCAEVGRDYNDIIKSLWAYVFVTKEGTQPIPDHDNRYQIFGTPGQVTDELARFIELGVQHFMLRFIDFPDTQGAELFLKDVLPAFQ